MSYKFCSKCGCSSMQSMRICPECGNRVFSDTQSTIRSGQLHKQNTHQNIAFANYAGFWERGAAYLIDICIIYIFLFLFGFFVGLALISSGQSLSSPSIVNSFTLIEIVAPLIYFCILESGPSKATIGKRLMGIHVQTTHMLRISVGQALGRQLGRLVSTILLFSGYLIQPFTAKKQTLHDLMAGTVVVRDGSRQHSVFAVICIFTAAFICLAIIATFAKLINQ